MEKVLKISSGKSLSKAIHAVIQESIKSDLLTNTKEEKHERLFKEENDLFDDEKNASKSSKTIEDEKEKLKKGDITTDDVIDKLNSIRSGKSFRDEVIKSKLSEYVESLSKAEKTALFAFLKGIAQLVTGEIESASATDPSDAPAGVKMKKTDSLHKKTVKPNVIKAPAFSLKKEKKKPGSEDTSGPVPISPKKAK